LSPQEYVVLSFVVCRHRYAQQAECLRA
jgi:hypothetical protein